MGIINIDVQNQYLLSKWLHKLINENGLWQDLLRKNYLQNKSIGQVQRKLEDSHFWLGVMKVKEHLDLAPFTLTMVKISCFGKISE
jgi:hypothetical protein